MNYEKIYTSLCLWAQIRDSSRIEHIENHRILPGWLAGTYTPENVAPLTPREHFLAHLLLFKIFRNPQSAYAVKQMRLCNPHQKRTINNSRVYESCRIMISEERSQRMKEKWRDPEYRELMSNMSKNMWKNPETLKKMKNRRKGCPKKKSIAAKQRMQDPEVKVKAIKTLDKHRERIKSDSNYRNEIGKRISKGLEGSTKNYTKKTCPHCGKEGAGPNMSRYHFDNCQKKSTKSSPPSKNL